LTLHFSEHRLTVTWSALINCIGCIWTFHTAGMAIVFFSLTKCITHADPINVLRGACQTTAWFI
jgi:hypothetical protein